MSPGIFSIAERFATLAALTLLLGAAIFRVRVLARVGARTAGDGRTRDFIEHLTALTLRTSTVAAAALLVLACIRLHLHVVELFDTWNNAGIGSVQALVFDTAWGHAWMLQVAATLVVVAGPPFEKRLDAWMAIPLALSAALAGHAASVPDIAPLAIGLEALHLLAAAGWIGGVWFVFAAFGLRHGPGDVFRVVQGFNVVALTCAAIVVTTGVFAAFVHIPSFDALVTTSYGKQLILKLFFVLLMVVVGAWNWRRGTPALALANDRLIRRGIAIELLVSAAIFIATARLVILPSP